MFSTWPERLELLQSVSVGISLLSSVAPGFSYNVALAVLGMSTSQSKDGRKVLAFLAFVVFSMIIDITVMALDNEGFAVGRIVAGIVYVSCDVACGRWVLCGGRIRPKGLDLPLFILVSGTGLVVRRGGKRVTRR